MNITHHKAINETPYEVEFGFKANREHRNVADNEDEMPGAKRQKRIERQEAYNQKMASACSHNAFLASPSPTVHRHKWALRNTGETPLSFIQLVTDVSPVLGRVNVHGDARICQRRQKINLINQILLALMWLRKYLHFDNLALWFDIDPASVVRIIYKVVPELWRYFQNQMQWPIDLEWTNMMGNWPEFPSAVGSIDSTPHEIYRPLTEPQILFYSGHRHYHCFNTQLIIDNQGRLRYVHAGFMGSMHDATSYRRMPQIGPGLPLSLPHGAHFLADRAYPDGVSLLTAVRAQQMPKDMKTYKCIGSIWRHPRWLMPICVELVAFFGGETSTAFPKCLISRSQSLY
ncbi:predicted protein [Nematostella vectensis]|uniref:DDE Tnp4 domain-containing protein n=1 Tax=Nematostella vectensis TaxID=45351 RepID=A7SB10_NEMVE|nr:predicted protein [Nematostella vectensis]|eukprot:XP_001631160.1 predicted protein [Nematostella vectensis]